MHDELVVQADGDHAAGKRTVGHGAIEHVECRLQARGHRQGCRLERHGIRSDAGAVAAFYCAGNRHGNFSGDGGLAEKGADCGALRNVVGGELREPRLCGGEVLDEIRAAERHDDGRLAGGEELGHERALVLGHAHVAFAVGDAHEKRGDGHVVGIGRRQGERADAGKLRVRAQGLQRIHAPADLGLDRFAGIGVGVGGKRNEQHAQRPRGIERQKLGRVPQQRDAAVRDALRLRFEFGPREIFAEARDINQAILVQPHARLC